MGKRINYNQRDHPRLDEKGVLYDWTPSPRPIPAAGICDFPCRCIKINENWLPFVIPALLRIGHADLWVGNDSDKLRAHDEINNLIGMLMACECGGGGSSVVTTINQSDVNTWINNAQTRYTTYDYTMPSTIGSGNADPATSVDVPRTSDALCAVLHFFVEQFRDIFKAATLQTNQQDGPITTIARYNGDWGEWLITNAASYFGVGAYSDEIATGISNYIGLRTLEHAARAIEGTTEVITETDLGSAWVEDMACYLFNAMNNETIEFDEWRQIAGKLSEITPIFDDHTADTSTREMAIGAWINYINDVGTFFGVFEMVDDLVSQTIESGQSIRCPCCNNVNTAPLPEVFFTWNSVPAGWVGDNPFRNLSTLGVQVGSTGAGHPIIEFPMGFINFRFSERIRVQRIRLGMCRPSNWPTGGNYGISATTQCFENVTDIWDEIAGFCDNGNKVDITFPGPSSVFGAHETRFIFVKKGSAPNVPPLRVWGMWLRYEPIP